MATMSKRIELLKILAQGGFHSGEALGRRLGVSRTAIWKYVKGLLEWGIDCHSVSGKGYRLAQPIELLSETDLAAAMDAEVLAQISSLEVLPNIDSTNRYLMERLPNNLNSGHVCLAEYQTAGRGRRGRDWVSPFGQNLYLSFYWRFDISPAVLSGLGLAIAVALVRALRRLGLEGTKLKWPNDVLWQGRKLAGILLEMKAEAQGPFHVVTGVGINLNMPVDQAGIDQPWVGVNQLMSSPIARNVAAGLIIEELILAARQFEAEALAPFIDEWRAADAFAGQAVDIHMANGVVAGTSLGIDASGALLIDTEAGVRSFHSGDVSLRPSGVAL